MEINKDGKAFIGFIIVLILAIVGVAYKVTTKNSVPEKNIMTITTTSGLQMTDEVIGTGAEAVSGKKVSVHYVGTFIDGKKFDSSLDRGQPFEFMLGASKVIKGWDEGIVGMRVGGKRKLVVPPQLGYGSRDYGPIPANSTLLFEVELLDVK